MMIDAQNTDPVSLRKEVELVSVFSFSNGKNMCDTFKKWFQYKKLRYKIC